MEEEAVANANVLKMREELEVLAHVGAPQGGPVAPQPPRWRTTPEQNPPRETPFWWVPAASKGQRSFWLTTRTERRADHAVAPPVGPGETWWRPGSRDAGELRERTPQQLAASAKC